MLALILEANMRTASEARGDPCAPPPPTFFSSFAVSADEHFLKRRGTHHTIRLHFRIYLFSAFESGCCVQLS